MKFDQFDGFSDGRVRTRARYWILGQGETASGGYEVFSVEGNWSPGSISTLASELSRQLEQFADQLGTQLDPGMS